MLACRHRYLVLDYATCTTERHAYETRTRDLASQNAELRDEVDKRVTISRVAWWVVGALAVGVASGYVVGRSSAPENP